MIRIGYLTVTPESTRSPIVGPSVYSQAPQTIEVVDMEWEITREYDQQHGTPSGDRKHHPLVIYKETDLTTPTLFTMCANAELCTEVKLEYFIQVGNSPDPVNFFTYTLANAYVADVSCIPARELGIAFEEQYDLLEKVSFIYQQITLEHHAHRHPIGLVDLDQVVASDAWSAIA